MEFDLHDLYVTEDRREMAALGEKLMALKAKLYDERMMGIIQRTINANMPDASEEEKRQALLCSVYDYWVYGNNIAEEFYFDFPHKTDAEKREYMTFRMRFLYMNHLSNKAYKHILDNKWEAYTLMKPYYRRDAILLTDEQDFDSFRAFTAKHPTFVVKPIGLCAGAGVHKCTVEGKDEAEVFHSILNEIGEVSRQNPYGDASKMMLEELIPQAEEMAQFNPASVQSIRLVTVKVNGKVHIWHPRVDIGRGGSFLINGAQGGIMACIDPDTGVIINKGIPESGECFERHPDTGVPILGFRIPEWDKLIAMATDLMLNVLPETGYVGWDMAYSTRGWCVVEGNWAGEFVGDQLGAGHGLRKEFEELIGWKPTQTYWWETGSVKD